MLAEHASGALGQYCKSSWTAEGTEFSQDGIYSLGCLCACTAEASCSSGHYKILQLTMSIADLGSVVVAVMTVELVLQLIPTVGRVYVRTAIKQLFGWDDVMAIFGLVRAFGAAPGRPSANDPRSSS